MSAADIATVRRAVRYASLPTWNDVLELDECVCGETSSRNCPVHQNLGEEKQP